MPDKAVQRSVTCTATEQVVSGKNPSRQYMLLVNDGDSDIYLAFGGPAVANKGVRLNANGGSFEINITNPWQGSINAVGDAGGPALLITEW